MRLFNGELHANAVCKEYRIELVATSGQPYLDECMALNALAKLQVQ